jgi:hypothetical protein
MAKQPRSLANTKPKTRSRKTKKRLAIKAAMLAAKKKKKHGRK